MTSIETKYLNVGDAVACGPHEGRVVGVSPHTVTIEWHKGSHVVHERTKMDAIQKTYYLER